MPTAKQKKNVVVLDFDGTITDVEAEGASYTEGFLRDLAALIGVPKGLTAAAMTLEVRRHAYTALAEIFAHPTQHAMEIDGQAVAPAIVDPYLRMTPISKYVLSQLPIQLDPSLRERLCTGILFKYNYERTVARPFFRDGAAELIRTLGRRDDLEVWVVTNSGTQAVRDKITRLDRDQGGGCAWLAERVRGNARKFVNDPSWAEGPDDLTLPGLHRKVLRRRRNYAGILSGLCGGDFKRLTLVGDIFELDLAMAHALGSRIALFQGLYTPDYELTYLRSQQRTHIIQDLSEVNGIL